MSASASLRLPRFTTTVPAALPGLLLLISLALAAWAGKTSFERRSAVLRPDRIIVLDDFPEISGIAWWPQRGTLIGVGDNGKVAELTLEGRVLRKRFYAQRDFEDLVLLPEAEQLLAIDEEGNRLLRLRLADFALLEERPLADDLPLTRRRNKRIEGMTAGAAGMVLAHEFPPALLTLAGRSPAAVTHRLLLDASSVSGVLAGPQGELLVVSREDGLLLLAADGTPLGGWHPVAHHHLEGVALVPGLGLVLCVDRHPGQLLVFSSLGDWSRLHDALAAGR